MPTTNQWKKRQSKEKIRMKMQMEMPTRPAMEKKEQKHSMKKEQEKRG